MLLHVCTQHLINRHKPGSCAVLCLDSIHLHITWQSDAATDELYVSSCKTKRCARQTASERQDLSRTYLAHHELESDVIILYVIQTGSWEVMTCCTAAQGAAQGAWHPQASQLKGSKAHSTLLCMTFCNTTQAACPQCALTAGASRRSAPHLCKPPAQAVDVSS